MIFRELLKIGIEKLEGSNIYTQSAQLLLLAYCQEENIDLYAHYQDEVPTKMITKFNQAIDRLIKDEPLAYVIGYQPFYGYDIVVDNRVLIPRSETEELVGEILMNIDNKFNDYQEIKAVDIATGSGAIAIAIAKEEPRIRMTATDISEDALAVAQINNNKHDANITLKKSDMLDSLLNEKFDLIICNPPYIKNDEILDNSVKDYEPSLALFGGNDGLDFYRRVLKDADKILNDRFIIAFEMGYDQGITLPNLARQYFNNCDIKVVKDINKLDRMLIITSK